jgi:hypothetical protein
VLGRLLGRSSPADPETARYAAAEELERSTQAHYRKVTGVDASGQATARPKQERPEDPK